MIASLGARIAQADEQFVGLQGDLIGVVEQADSLPQAGGGGQRLMFVLRSRGAIFRTRGAGPLIAGVIFPTMIMKAAKS